MVSPTTLHQIYFMRDLSWADVRKKVNVFLELKHSARMDGKFLEKEIQIVKSY